MTLDLQLCVTKERRLRLLQAYASLSACKLTSAVGQSREAQCLFRYDSTRNRHRQRLRPKSSVFSITTVSFAFTRNAALQIRPSIYTRKVTILHATITSINQPADASRDGYRDSCRKGARRRSTRARKGRACVPRRRHRWRGW